MQKQIPPHIEEAFVMASLRADRRQRALVENIPALMADAFSRLESAAFATGAGDGQRPVGSYHQSHRRRRHGHGQRRRRRVSPVLITNLPPRFRLDPARPDFLANIAIINMLRQTTAFTAATQAIVDDSTTPPKVFGIPLEESSDMDSSNAAGGHKNLLLFDTHSFLIAERLGTSDFV